MDKNKPVDVSGMPIATLTTQSVNKYKCISSSENTILYSTSKIQMQSSIISQTPFGTVWNLQLPFSVSGAESLPSFKTQNAASIKDPAHLRSAFVLLCASSKKDRLSLWILMWVSTALSADIQNRKIWQWNGYGNLYLYLYREKNFNVAN